MKNQKGQQNFLDQGFGRDKCLLNSQYACTHYWVVWTMQHCDNKDCDNKCCKGCTETCGYRCNAAAHTLDIVDSAQKLCKATYCEFERMKQDGKI